MTSIRFVINDKPPTDKMDQDTLVFALTFETNTRASTHALTVTHIDELQTALSRFQLHWLSAIDRFQLTKLKNSYVFIKSTEPRHWELQYVSDEGTVSSISMSLLPTLSAFLNQLNDQSVDEIRSNQQHIDQVRKLLSAHVRKQNYWLLHIFCSQLKDILSNKLPIEFKQAPACLPIFASNALEEFVKNAMDANAKQLTMSFLKQKNYIICRINDDGIGFPQAYLDKDKERKGHTDRANINHILLTQHGKYSSEKEWQSTHGGRGKGLAQTNERMQCINGTVYVGNASESKHGYIELAAPSISYRLDDPLFKQMPIEFQLYLCKLWGAPLQIGRRSQSPEIVLDKMPISLPSRSKSTDRFFKEAILPKKESAVEPSDTHHPISSTQYPVISFD